MVLSRQGHYRTQRIRSVRHPLLHRIVRFWHFFPWAAHFGIKLHLDCAFVEIVRAHEDHRHKQARDRYEKNELGVKEEICVGFDELHWQKAGEVHDLKRIEHNRPQQVRQLVLRWRVSLHVRKLKVLMVHLETRRNPILSTGTYIITIIASLLLPFLRIVITLMLLSLLWCIIVSAPATLLGAISHIIIIRH